MSEEKHIKELSLVSILKKIKDNIGSLEVVRYRFEFINGKPKIVIDQVKVLDKNGKYIKFAKLKGVYRFLSQFPISFKKLE